MGAIRRARSVLAFAVLTGTLGVAVATTTGASAAPLITTKTLIVSTDPPAGGVNISSQFTAEVDPQAAGPAVTGTVTFTYKVVGGGSHEHGTIGTPQAVGSDDRATVTAVPGALPADVLTITATYSGDANYSGSSGAVAYTESPNCFTGSWPAQTSGFPTVEPGDPTGVYIGQSNGFWTVDVAHPEHMPNTLKFSGTVTTDERIVDVTALKNEPIDVVKLNGKGQLSFKLYNKESLDGFSFFAGCGSQIKFKIDIAGVPAPPSEIFLGNPTTNPAANPVTFNRPN